MLTTVLLVLFGGAGLVWLGRVSIQSIRQAAILHALPKGDAGAMEGSKVAIHGAVQIHDPLTIPGIGPCLWCRVIEKELDSLGWGLVGGRRRWRTISDSAQMASFSITAGGQTLNISDLPTEVQGTISRRDSEDSDLLGQILSEGNYVQIYEWLPVLQAATVVGKLERRGDGRVVVVDPELGLLLSPKPSDQAASLEWTKGIAGLLGVVAGAAALYVLVLRVGLKG